MRARTGRGLHRRRRRLALAPLLLLAVGGCGGGQDGVQDRLDRFDAEEELAPRARGAWRRLREVSYFGETLNPSTWDDVEPARDAMELWRRGETDALLEVASAGTWAGRLWAMSALRHTDPDRFEALAPGFRSCDTLVRSGGCLVERIPVSQWFETHVLDDGHLLAAYERAWTGSRGLEDLKERRGSRLPHLRTDRARSDLRALAASDRVDVGGELERTYRRLLEEEARLYQAGTYLATADEPAVRYWGAALLHEVHPSQYRRLRSDWALGPDADQVACDAHLEPTSHSLDEALRLHVEPH